MELKTRRIIVAIDGSGPSDRALDRAIELARAIPARLELVHVVVLPGIPIELPPAEAAALVTSEQQAAEALMERTLDRVRAQGVEAVGHVDMGQSPADRVIRLAADDAWAVIVGSHGRGAMGRLLLGSVSTALLHHCQRPVMVVR